MLIFPQIMDRTGRIPHSQLKLLKKITPTPKLINVKIGTLKKVNALNNQYNIFVFLIRNHFYKKKIKAP